MLAAVRSHRGLRQGHDGTSMGHAGPSTAGAAISRWEDRKEHAMDGLIILLLVFGGGGFYTRRRGGRGSGRGIGESAISCTSWLPSC
jgi:hypothetical protein